MLPFVLVINFKTTKILLAKFVTKIVKLAPGFLIATVQHAHVTNSCTSKNVAKIVHLDLKKLPTIAALNRVKSVKMKPNAQSRISYLKIIY